MNFNNTFDNYINEGYLAADFLGESQNLTHKKKLIIDQFKDSDNNYLSFDKFGDKLQLEILKIYNDNYIKNFLEQLSSSTNSEVVILPRIFIMKNYHINRFVTDGIGWHKDCSGEMSYKFCNNLLKNKKYAMGKIGIYLQKNEEYGGSIDVIPKSHFYIKNNKKILRKIKGFNLKLIKIIHKYLPNLYKKFNENFYMKFLGAVKINSKPGSAVFFDSRTTHRGTPISDSIVKKLEKIDDYHINTPKELTKIAIYCHFGSVEGISSYFYGKMQRNANDSELDDWKKEINIYNKYFPEMYNSAKKLLEKAKL